MVGKTINSILSGSSTLTTLLGQTSTVKKIYPYVMNEDTALPAVVYRIESVQPGYTKGGWSDDDVSFSVWSFSKGYDELQSVTSAVRSALELNKTGATGQSINRIYMTGMNEYYDPSSDTFINQLNFSVIVNSY